MSESETQRIPVVTAVVPERIDGRFGQWRNRRQQRREDKRRERELRRQRRKESKKEWRRTHGYVYKIVPVAALYVAVALALICSAEAALMLFAALVGFLATLTLGLIYVKFAQEEWITQRPMREQMTERHFVKFPSCTLPKKLIPVVMARFYANPVTGVMGEQIVRLQLRHKWKFWKSFILTSLIVGPISVLCIIPAFFAPWRVSVGLWMLLLLVHVCITGLQWASYESVIQGVTDFRVFELVSPSIWLWWKREDMPYAPIRSIDFGQPHRTWLGRKLDEGTLGNDTASDADDKLHGMSYVKEVTKVSSEIAEMQRNMYQTGGRK